MVNMVISEQVMSSPWIKRKASDDSNNLKKEKMLKVINVMVVDRFKKMADHKY
jgi:hypothetical protein